MSDRIKDIGEGGLLKLIQPFCPGEVIGDDGAVLDVKSGHKLVVTTDVLVDEVHFSDRTTEPFDVGWRSAAANLSDLAAMGANPIGITVGLSLPGATPIAWVQKLYEGISGCLQQFETPIVGGDVTRSSVITVAITAFGEVLPQRVITRSSAKPGDAILITGYHGLSRSGLELLLNPSLGANLSSEETALLTKAHQRPQPRLDVISKLRQIASDAVVAGMDSSDGLGDAIAQICRCSSVGATIDLEAISRCRILDKLPANYPTSEWILNGGEDFELVLSLAPQIARKLLLELGEGAAIIGKCDRESRILLREVRTIREIEVRDLTAQFQHFST